MNSSLLGLHFHLWHQWRVRSSGAARQLQLESVTGMGEISDADLRALTTVNGAADRAGLEGTLGDNTTPRGSFFVASGAVANTRVISTEDCKATVQRWQIKQTPSGGGEPVDRPPTLMEASQALYIGRLARMKLGRPRRQQCSDIASSSIIGHPQLPLPLLQERSR